MGGLQSAGASVILGKGANYVLCDPRYPQTNQEILFEQNTNNKTLAWLIYTEMQRLSQGQIYLKCVAEPDGKQYIEVADNNHIH